MTSLIFIDRRGLALALLSLLAVHGPATAAIEKFMRHCEGKLCAYFRAPVTIPNGWVEDQEASRALGVQMLLPNGVDFEKAPAKIYVLVRYNREKQSLSVIQRDVHKDWRARANDAKIVKLTDIVRKDGQVSFQRHRFEALRLAKQGFELTSVTADSDKDGNAYFVVIVLSANTREAFNAAEAAYLSILNAY